MLARLQKATELYHGAASAQRLELIGGAVTVDRYRGFLDRVHGFEMPVEAALTLTLGLDDVLDLRGRNQIRLLRADLRGLGVGDPATLPRCLSVPIHDVPEALGWVYAVERNTALHGVLERHLHDRLPDVMRQAGSYLAVQERSVGARMRDLGHALDSVATRPAIADRIIHGAKAAFRHQRSWYELTESWSRAAS